MRRLADPARGLHRVFGDRPDAPDRADRHSERRRPPNPAVGNPAYVVINPPLAYPIAPTANYRIVRAPRPVGDETLKMPDNTMIDFATNAAFNNPLARAIRTPEAVGLWTSCSRRPAP